MQGTENIKSKSNGLLVVVIILLIILIGVGSVLIYQNYQDKNVEPEQKEEDNTEKEENKEIITNLSLNNSIVEQLSKVFYGKFLTTGASEYDDFFYKNDKTNLNDVNNSFRLAVVYFLLDLDRESSFSSDTLKLSYESVFGKGTYHPQNFGVSDCHKFEYDQNKEIYHASLGGCGGTTCGGSKSKLVKAEKITNDSQNRIEITEAVAFEGCPDFDNDNGTSPFYKDYNKTEFVENYDYTKNPLDEHPEKYAQYKYTFVENSDGIYVFTSVEKIK